MMPKAKCQRIEIDYQKIKIYYQKKLSSKSKVEVFQKEVSLKITTYKITDYYSWSRINGPLPHEVECISYKCTLEFSNEIRKLQAGGFIVSIPIKEIEAEIKDKFPNEWLSKVMDISDASTSNSLEFDNKKVWKLDNVIDYSSNSEGKFNSNTIRGKINCRANKVDLVFGNKIRDDVTLVTSQSSYLFWTIEKTYQILVAD